MKLLLSCLIGFLLASCSTSTIYVVRHAEKLNESDTSSLTAEGTRRARALADRLAEAGIDSILTTPYRRTELTAAPLAERLRLPIVHYPAQPAAAVAQRLQQAKGKNVLVVGHSNTILDIVKALGATPARTRIESGDFDNLYRLTIRRQPFNKRLRLQELTYGQPTAP